ncbi:MAG: hypothetical protein ABI832_05500 [bacterium]
MQTARRISYGWLAFLGTVAAMMAVSIYWPKKPLNETMRAKLTCVARSVALSEHVFARQQAGETFPPDFLADLEERQTRLYRFMTSLQRSDDPARLAYRPIMAQLQAARDTAVAQDSVAYLTSTWAEVQTCDDTFFKGQAA